MSRDEFYDLAPCEVEREFKGAQLRRQDELQRDIVLAWHTAILSRAKTIPSLDKLLSQIQGGTRKQTPQEMKERIRGLVGEFKTKRRTGTDG